MTIQLHVDIEHLVCYNTIVYQIMHGMSDDDDELCKVLIVLKLNEHEILVPVQSCGGGEKSGLS